VQRCFWAAEGFVTDTYEKYRNYLITSFVRSVAPVVIEKAEGAVITDVDGREYIDCFSGIAVVNAGHCNPRVIAAARTQMEKLIHGSSYLYHVQPTADLAEKMAQITPHGLTKSFFGNSGAEAIEGALKLARLYTGRHEFIALQGGFHGRSWGTLSISGYQGRKKGGGPYAPGVAFAPAPYTYRSHWPQDADECGRQCAHAIEELIHYATSNDVAAFIAEHYGVAPDILVTAKGIADGFPLSAFTTREDIAAAFKAGDHLSTFGGNPVSCAAALANIDFLQKENICDRVTDLGQYVKSKLNELHTKNPLVGDIRGLGLMIGMELVKDEAGTPAAQEAEFVRDACLRHGLIVGLGGTYANVVRFQPPLVISREQIDQAINIISKAFEELEQ
jgi:4-aminobutyrate aminotransferase/(S)-3-amino-2-methylpropionate transaminase